MNRTELAVANVRCSPPDRTEADIIRTIVREVNAAFDTDGPVDSHIVASEFFTRRGVGGFSWEQTKDYVQHLFREADHVCRHADGHHYTIHRAAKCSADCDVKFAARLKSVRRPVSVCCFVETTTQGTCPFGCDEE